MFRFLFAYLLLQHGLQQTESQCSLCRSTRFGDIDDTELLVREELHQFCEVILSDVITGINDIRIFAVFGYEGIKSRTERLIHSASAEIRTADTGYNHYFATTTQFVRRSLYFSEELIRDRGGQMYPSDVVVSCSLTILQEEVGGFGLRLQFLQSSGVHKARCVLQTQFHDYCNLVVNDLIIGFAFWRL